MPFFDNYNSPLNKKTEEKRRLLFKRLNSRHKKEVQSPVEKEAVVVAPIEVTNDNITKDKENVNYEERRKRKITALERRRKSREKVVARYRAKRMERRASIDIIETTKTFLEGTACLLTSTETSVVKSKLPCSDGSKLSVVEVASHSITVEPEEIAEKRNSVALASWINKFLGVSQNSTEDVRAFSERARNVADEALRNMLQNPDLPTDVVVGVDESPEETLRKTKRRIELVSRSKTCIQGLGILEKIKNLVEDQNDIAVENLRIYSDVGMQREVTGVMLGFSPVWLHIALECVFDVKLNIVDYSGGNDVFITLFRANLFLNKKIMDSKKFCPTGTKASITQIGVRKLQHHFITKILQILTVIEYLQRFNIMEPSNIPIFTPHSNFQSSKEVIGWIRKTFISTKFDLTKALKKIDINFKYEQTYHDNYSYVVKNIGTDLSDGFILAKVAERIFKIEDNTLISSLRPPNGDRLRKLGNVRIVLKTLKDHNLDIQNIKSEDIVQGKLPQIMELLWKLIGVFKVQKDHYEVFRRISKRLKKLSSSPNDSYSDVPSFLKGFEIVLYVSKQFGELCNLNIPIGIENYADDVGKFEGRSLISKILKIGEDVMEIPKELTSLKIIECKQYRKFELFVKTFMERCFIVMEREEAALAIQRFFKNIILKKKSNFINIEEYSRKWYEEKEQEKKEVIKNLVPKKMQAAHKKYKSRGKLGRLVKSLVNVKGCIKKIFKKKTCEKVHRRMVSSAIIIQRSWKSYLLRKNVRKAIEKKKIEKKIIENNRRILAAEVIQRSWRCYKARVYLEKLKNEKEIKEIKEKSALIIQSAYRRYIQRRNMKIIQSSPSDNATIKNVEENIEIKNLAATKIQAWFKGVSIRRKFFDEIQKRNLKMKKLGEEVAKDKNLDIEDLKIPLNNRFYRICEMLDSDRIRHYKKPFLQLARLLRYTPTLGIHFVFANGHKSLCSAIKRLRRSPLEQEVNSLFSEILYYLLINGPCFKRMRDELVNLSEIIWHYFYAHYTNVDVVYYLGNCILILKKNNAPPECFKKSNFYIGSMKRRFSSLPLHDKRSKVIRELEIVFK